MGSRYPLMQIERLLARALWPYHGQCRLAQDGSLIINIFPPNTEDSYLTLFSLAPEHFASDAKVAELVESIEADLEAILPTLGLPPTCEAHYRVDCAEVDD